MNLQEIWTWLKETKAVASSIYLSETRDRAQLLLSSQRRTVCTCWPERLLQMFSRQDWKISRLT